MKPTRPILKVPMPRNHIRITPDIESSIRRCTLEGNTLVMPDPAIAKFDNWPAMKKVFDALGGKWNKKAQAVVFPSDAAELLLPAVDSGSVLNKKQHFQFFPTPRSVAETAIRAMLEDHAFTTGAPAILEPSAGRGDLADVASELIVNATTDCVEIQEDLHSVLAGKGYSVIGTDFIAIHPKPIYDFVVMNPPFQAGQDIAHARHAYGFLRVGGAMVSILSSGVHTGTVKAVVKFREWVDEVGGNFHHLPENSFKESGTGATACFVVIHRTI